MRLLIMLSAVAALALATGCVSDPVSMMGCRFRIASTSDFYLDGIRLDDLTSLDSAQTAQVEAALAAGECPASYAVVVEADNPDNTGDVIIQDFYWDAVIDTRTGEGRTDVYLDAGGISAPVTVPNSRYVEIDCVVEFDAARDLHEDEGLSPEEVISLCLAAGGADSDIRDEDHLGRTNLEVTMTEDTPLGLILINFPVTLGIDWIQPE